MKYVERNENTVHVEGYIPFFDAMQVRSQLGRP